MRLLQLRKKISLLALAAISWLLGAQPAQATFAFQETLADKYYTDLFGFIELRGGARLQDDPYEKSSSIAEMRLQLDLSSDLGWGIVKFKGDVIGDEVEEDVLAQLREFNLATTPFSNMDLKLGRQVLTWGTGDLLFITDLFPKDWESFFIGRDDEYLKAPSDAIKASIFMDFINVDLVYMPLFNPSVYIDGARISYWNSALGRIAGRDYVFEDEELNTVGPDSAFSMRLSRNIGSVEFAAYGYYGFWSTPEGMNPVTMKLIYPRLGVYGFSLRGNMLGGIANLEAGYYDSMDDPDGDDPFIRNSEARVLLGFERELVKNLTSGFQYYLEQMQQYDDYEAALPPGAPAKDEQRHVLTLRLTQLLMNQNLRISLFVYFSPSDEDGYVRPKVHYKITDQWAAEIGGNVFFGNESHTFFGQFEDNTNAYAGLRWNF